MTWILPFPSKHLFLGNLMASLRFSPLLATALLVLLAGPGNAPLAAEEDRPNIVWIVVEDMSLPFGCYGETDIQTPNVDALAHDGLRFDRAFVTAPVCSTCLSGFSFFTCSLACLG